jgi:hypothetical protein
MNGVLKLTLGWSTAVMLGCLLLGSGCAREPAGIEDRALKAYSDRGYEGAPEVLVDPVVVSPDGEEPSANEAMATFILDRAGESVDLSSYEAIALVTFKQPDGSEVRGVMINGDRTVFADVTSSE